MSKIKVGENEYDVLSSWDEITLEKALEIRSVGIPEKLEKHYKFISDDTGKLKQVKFSVKDMNHIFPAWYLKVIAVMSDIPEDVAKEISHDDRSLIYNNLLEPFVIGVNYAGVTYEITQMDSFKFEGETYIFPKSSIIMGKERPMYDESFITWAEVDDLIKEIDRAGEHYLSVAHHCASIICRPEGEKYVEAVSLERAEEFRKLPMPVIWQVFFCTVRLVRIFSKATAYQAAGNHQSKRVQLPLPA